MFPESSSRGSNLPGSLRRTGGFSILIALFVLLVLGALAVFIVSLSGVEHRTPLLQLQATRAYWAAESGLQWGMHETLKNSACPAATTLTAPGLAGFSAQVSCTATQHTEQGKTFSVYALTSVANNGTFGSRVDFVQRKLEATIVNAP
jgi:MSHA biogenesis protein MshP